MRPDTDSVTVVLEWLQSPDLNPTEHAWKNSSKKKAYRIHSVESRVGIDIELRDFSF